MASTAGRWCGVFVENFTQVIVSVLSCVCVGVFFCPRVVGAVGSLLHWQTSHHTSHTHRLCIVHKMVTNERVPSHCCHPTGSIWKIISFANICNNVVRCWCAVGTLHTRSAPYNTTFFLFVFIVQNACVVCDHFVWMPPRRLCGNPFSCKIVPLLLACKFSDTSKPFITIKRSCNFQ